MTELYLFAGASVFLTAHILVYTTWSGTRQLERFVRPFLILLGIVPGFLSVCIGVVLLMLRPELANAWAFLSAGLLLETGSVRLYVKAHKPVKPTNRS